MEVGFWIAGTIIYILVAIKVNIEGIAALDGDVNPVIMATFWPVFYLFVYVVSILLGTAYLIQSLGKYITGKIRR
ncbi:hypothetical protein LCGC14_0738690 [marine sediment metagenome]|uniref:Uncharacterized protein n=1 Tax=marine sediment metagenome TaxID=412755 RepID=A0A0F9QBK8_9ZZZZ